MPSQPPPKKSLLANPTAWAIALTAIGTIAAVASVPAFQPLFRIGSQAGSGKGAGNGPETAAGAFLSGMTARDYETEESGVALVRRYLKRGSLETLQRFAAGGNPEAQYLLGVSKLYGIGQSRDAEGALPWFEKAWAAGFQRAGLALGLMFYNGFGVAREPERAMDLWRQGAESRFLPCIETLGWALAFGELRLRNVESAKALLDRAAESGSMLAVAYLGDLYAFGAGVKRDEAAAFERYRTSAEAGSAYGQLSAAKAYQHGIGTAVDLEKALRLYLAAAAQGNGVAAVHASELFLSGKVQERSVVRAVETLEAAIEFGSPEAKAALADLALREKVGEMGAGAIRQLALEADSDGFPAGLVAFVRAQAKGDGIVPRDLAEAGHLARQGLGRAEARPLSAEGAWPVFRAALAAVLQQALREGAIEEQRPGELAHLDRVYGARWNMKKFNFPARCGSRVEQLEVMVWDSTAPAPPTSSQFRWWEQARGCAIPHDVEESFTRIYKIALDKKVSYAELLASAIGKAP